MIKQTLLNREFPQEKQLLYLNHAAVSPWPRRTSEAVSRFAEENSSHGAEHYKRWSAREMTLRKQLQSLINAPSVEDIALLKNTSEAISVVAEGIDWRSGDNVVTSNEEFPSNRIPWEAQSRHGVVVRQAALQCADPEQALIDACDDKTRLMTISSVQYGSGLRLDLDRLGDFCRRNNILFCVDAIQSIGAYDFDVQSMQADFAMADAHKWMLGPEGIAVFYCREELRDKLQLHQYGWHMVEHAGDYDRQDWEVARSAKRFECGTPNMLGTFALSASISLLEEIGMKNIETRVLANAMYLRQALSSIAGLKILGDVHKPEQSAIVTFSIADRDPAGLYRELMAQRIICANRAGGIRFSPHFYTPEEKLDRAVELLASLL